MTTSLFILLQERPPIDEGFDLFLFVILMLGFVFMAISTVIAIIIAILILLVIFGCIAMGALSTSVLVGINKKSFTTGFRTFVMVFSTLFLTVVGMGSFWILNKITHWWSQMKAIIIGLSVGFISGIVAGFLLALLIKKLSTFLKNKLDQKNKVIV